MDKAKAKVQTAVNAEIKRRIEQFQGGAKLKHQSPHEWVPNASFVNCYDGGSERRDPTYNNPVISGGTDSSTA